MRLARTITTIAVAVLAYPAVSLAQPPPRAQFASGTALVVGQVVDGVTGKGINSSLVTLAGSRRVMTTSDGRFVFFDVPAGSHGLGASKPGYIDGGYGSRRAGSPSTPLVLKDGERIGDVVIRLWRPGSISGTIVDEMGEPLVGIQVIAFARPPRGAQRRVTQGGMGTTDDRGLYRISRLAPGDYVVSVPTTQVSVSSSVARQYEDSIMTSSGNPSRNTLFQSVMEIGGTTPGFGSPYARTVGDHVQMVGQNAPTPPPFDGPELYAYPTVYYPAAPSVDSAAIVTVASAQERTGLDLQLKPVPTARVSGTVAGVGELGGLPVRLVPLGSIEETVRRFDGAGTVTEPNGAFTFVAVPAGDYTLRITQSPRPTGPTSAPMTIQVGSGTVVSEFTALPLSPTVASDPIMWAALPLAVGGSDLTGVTVVLRPGIRISGRVEFEGASERPKPEQLTQILVAVEPESEQLNRFIRQPSHVDAKGQFTTFGNPAGSYRVRAVTALPGWTFKGAMLGERDLSETAIELESGDVSDVVLTFTDRPASINGTVQMTESGARDGVAVVVFPSDAKLWQEAGASSKRLRRVSVTDAGAFEVRPVPSGDYYVAAILESAASDWMDPKFLESLVSVASHVQIDEGEKAALNLRVVEVR